MPRFHPAEGSEMSILRATNQSHYRGEEALPIVRRIGVQDDPAGGSATGAEKGAEDHGVCGVREAGVGAGTLFVGSFVANFVGAF